jgi:uncharacterized DUF497 family protein
MQHLRVAVFVWDSDNEDKVGRHGLSSYRVDQVLQNPFHLQRNRRARAGTHLLIGQDNGGQCIAVPIQNTGVAGVWRPVTAWYCKPHEWNYLEHAR